MKDWWVGGDQTAGGTHWLRWWWWWCESCETRTQPDLLLLPPLVVVLVDLLTFSWRVSPCGRLCESCLRKFPLNGGEMRLLTTGGSGAGRCMHSRSHCTLPLHWLRQSRKASCRNSTSRLSGPAFFTAARRWCKINTRAQFVCRKCSGW